MPSWTTVLTSNLKMAAVGTLAVVVTGTGAATTLSLAGDSSDVPAGTVVASPSTESSPEAETPDVVESESPAPEASPDADEAGETPEVPEASEVPDATEQPTDGTEDAPAADSHGACVSAAVHAAQAAPLAEGQNRGSAVSAAAHSCPKTDAAKTETDQESADDSATAPQQETAKPARTKAQKTHKSHKAHKAAHGRKAHGKK